MRPSELPRELASRKHECLQVVSGRRHPSCNGSAAGMAVHFCSSFRAVPCQPADRYRTWQSSGKLVIRNVSRRSSRVDLQLRDMILVHLCFEGVHTW